MTVTNMTTGEETIFEKRFSYETQMGRYKFWGLTQALARHGCLALGLCLALCGLAGEVAVASTAVAIVRHNPRYLASRRLAVLGTVGRFALVFPLLACVYVAMIGNDFEQTDEMGPFEFDGNEIVVEADWKRAILGELLSGVAWSTAVVIVAQLLCRLVLLLGRASRARFWEELCGDDVDAFLEEDDTDACRTTWSLQSRTDDRRSTRRRGYTTAPLVVSVAALAIGLFTPIAHIYGHVSQEVRFESVVAGVTLEETFEFRSSRQSTTLSAWGLASLLVDKHGIHGVCKTKYAELLGLGLVHGLVVILPLFRATLALLLWLIPVSTAAHRVALVFLEFASTLVSHDMFAFAVALAALELERFVVKSLDNGLSGETHDYRVALTGWFAVLVVAAIVEQATSAWVTWRLTCELAPPDSPTRVMPFFEWLKADDGAEECPPRTKFFAAATRYPNRRAEASTLFSGETQDAPHDSVCGAAASPLLSEPTYQQA